MTHAGNSRALQKSVSIGELEKHVEGLIVRITNMFNKVPMVVSKEQISKDLRNDMTEVARPTLRGAEVTYSLEDRWRAGP